MKISIIDELKGFFYLIIIIGSAILALSFIYFIADSLENYSLSKFFMFFNVAVLCLLPFYYWICNRREKRITQKLEEKIVIKNMDFQYYRDILDEYSPTTLSFILDGIEIRKDFIASVIYLINKGYFKLTDDKKIERTDKSCEKLPKDLKFLCSHEQDMIYIGTTKISEYIRQSEKMQARSNNLRIKWYDLALEEAVSKGLVNERSLGKFGKFSVILIYLFVFQSFYSFVLGKYVLLVFSIILALIIAIMTYWASDENKWVKTQKGFDLYTKVIGLRNYVNDYSLLSEREVKDVAIWEDYLIYSIIFNNFSKLNKDAFEFYKTICDII